MILWHFGNTTVRSPFRLRDGLIALSKSNLQGNLRGKEVEIAFGNLLEENGIISRTGDETYSVARKWRSSMCQLGFLYHKLSRDPESETQKKLGKADTITENGRRLIEVRPRF